MSHRIFRSSSLPRSLSTALVFALLVPLGCGSHETGPDEAATSSGGQGTTCEGAECEPACTGAMCEHPDDCEVTGCPSGQVCSSAGTCVEDNGDIVVGGSGGVSNDPEKGTGGEAVCVEVQVEYEKVIPTVSLLIDRSGSMGIDPVFGFDILDEIDAGNYEPWGCPTVSPETGEVVDLEFYYRWNVVRNVLFNPTTGVVPKNQDQVRFGMTLYTHQSDAEPALCPNLIDVDFAVGNSDELLAAMKCDDVGQYTPTRESLAATANRLAAFEATGPKMIVLATDGAPTTCECTVFNQTEDETTPEHCLPESLVERDGESMTPEQAAAYDVVAEARRIHDELGIVVSVIGLSARGNMNFFEHLGNVAEAGGGALFDGVKPTGLADAFQTSVDEVRSCEVDLQGEIVSGYEDEGVVTLDGQPLAITTPGGDGYHVVSSSRIELLGVPCEQLTSGGHQLDISFPCDTFEVIR